MKKWQVEGCDVEGFRGDRHYSGKGLYTDSKEM